MAFSHIDFDSTLDAGRRLRSMLSKAEQSDDEMADVRDMMIRMCEGDDASSEANFAEVAAKFGFPSNAKAKAAFDEIDSAYSKTSGNGSVSNVRAARDQLYAKLR